MTRLYWNLRFGLVGGYFLTADKCQYFISIYNTRRGTRCDLVDHHFTPIRTNLSINYAKRLAKKLNK